MRASCVVFLVLVLLPAVASAQSVAPSVSIQAAAGPMIVDSGHQVSAAVGFSPMSRVMLLLDVQRTQRCGAQTLYTALKARRWSPSGRQRPSSRYRAMQVSAFVDALRRVGHGR